tara:strand:- start:6114 stop:6326 length:213 start_codon:yes stop_codon:yes gene_type:complete
MYVFFEKMNSLNRYEVQKTRDTELLYNRVEDLENDVKVMQTLMETFATQVEKINSTLHDNNMRVKTTLNL